MKRLLSRVRAQEGFGIIELSIAMVMLNVGILAIVAAFNSGAVSLARASKEANATVIADTYLERYRGFRNCQIYLSSSLLDTTDTDATYRSDTQALSSKQYDAAPPDGQITDAWTGQPATYAPIPDSCTSQAPPAAFTTPYTNGYVGPDNRTYSVDVYIIPVQVTGGGYQKQVTVVVRDPDTGNQLARESSRYDPFDAP